MKGSVILLTAMCLSVRRTTGSPDGDVTDTCSNKFNCEYNVLLKLIKLEDKAAQQEAQISSLTQELKDAKDTIVLLNNTVIENKWSSQGTTYVRWGRTTCPGNARLVYDGYVAGSHYKHAGTAVNSLCLPTDPIYDKYTEGFQGSGRLYGAEYKTSSYPSWSYLHDHDIPCAVCRIPRTDVLMVPGKNVCHDKYVLEYKGYLMSSHYGHHASEFVCIDDQPEILKGGDGSINGKLFYFVESVCKPLTCPPYENARELTCAVCSFSPDANSKSLQPYI